MAENLRITCLECGTGYEVSEGTDMAKASCPKCHTAPAVYFPYAKTLVFASPEGVQPITLGSAPTPTPGTAPASVPPAKVPERIGKYAIVATAGKGGMGVVYRARHSELNRTVALKVMVAGEHATEETIQRFQREARSAAVLQHPNIVGVFDVGQENSLYYFVMEYVDGVTLDRLIREEGVKPEEAARIVRDLARALDYAHQRNIIHRDIKPSNILVDRNGAAKLADFGLAKSLTEDGTLTETGEIIGTAYYMPPEQASGSMKNVDSRSDIYALGAVLYEMLTRKPPFGGDTVMAVIKQVEESDPIAPTKISGSISRDLETICLKAMSKEKDRRYQTAGAMADDLDAYLKGSPISARPSGLFYRAGKWARRNPAGSSALAVGLVAIVVVAALAWRNWQLRHRPPPPAPQDDTPERFQKAQAYYLRAEHEIEKARAFQAGDRPKRRASLEKAVTELNDAIARFPKYAMAYFQRGVARSMLAQPALALADFTQAVNMDPKLADAYYYRIRIRIRALRDRIARGSFFASAGQMFEPDRDLILKDVKALEKLGLDPDLQIKKEYYFIAQAQYLMTGPEKKDALDLVNKSLEVNPAFADAYVVRATIQFDSAMAGGSRDEKTLHQALEDCNKAIGYEVNNREAYKVRAAIQLRLENYSGAITDLDEMVAIAPEEGQTWIDRAMVLENDPSHGRSREEITKSFDKALQLDPSNPTAHFFKAVHLLEGSHGTRTRESLLECRRELDASLAADPTFTSALVFRMVCDLALEEETAFDQDFAMFSRLSKDFSAGDLEQIKGSIRTLAAILRTDKAGGNQAALPETELMSQEALVLLNSRKLDEAEKKYKEVLRRLDDPEVIKKEGLIPFHVQELKNFAHYNLACVYSLLNNLDRCLEELESSLKGGFSQFDHLDQDTDFNNVKQERRFHDLVERYRKK